MKKIFLLIVFIFSFVLAYSQSTLYLRGDTVRVKRDGGNSTLIIENATRGVTGGVLTNVGNGRTAFVSPGGGSAGGIDTVQTISQLNSYAGGAGTVIVTDSLRGGIFHRVTSATADSGTVFNNSGSYFQRLYETSQGLNIEWFGAVPTFTLAAQSSPVMAANRIAFQNTINAAIKTGGRKITIPSGYFHVDSTIEVGTLQQASNPYVTNYNGLQISIDGSPGSFIIINHATATLLRVSEGTTKFNMNNVSLAGRGSATKGMLLEMNGLSNWKLNNIEFKGHGGVGLFLTTSERGETHGLQFSEVRQAIKTGIGASNEVYFYNTIEVACGYTADNFTGGLAGSTVNYNVNTGSGIYYSEKHAVDQIRNAANVRFIGGSTKVTIIAGKKISNCENVGIDNQYFEGYNLYANPSIILGGSSEKTHLSASLSNTSKSASVQDQSWFTQISTDARFDSVADNPQLFVIYDSTAPATYEVVSVYSFRNNVAKIKARAQNGTTALSWSSGACFREFLDIGNSGNVDVFLTNNHLESYSALPSGFTSVDTTTKKGSTRGEVVVGYTPDEFHLSSYSFTAPSARVELANNDTRTYALPNGGKFQMWNLSTAQSTTSIPLSTFVAAQGDFYAPLSTIYNITAPNINYTNISSNVLPYSLLTDTYKVNLGGNGQTPIIAGERGVALSKSNLAATDIVSFDDKQGIGFKYRKYNGSDWIIKSALFETSVQVGDLNVGIYLSNGSPNGSISATKGSLALDTANGIAYIKKTGYSVSGWVPNPDTTGFSGFYANRALSNLSAVSINTSLIPQSGLNLGGTGNFWSNLYVSNALIRNASTGITPVGASFLTVENNNGDAFINMIYNSGSAGGLIFGNNTSNFSGALQYYNSVKKMFFKVNGDDIKATLDSNGYFGLGTTSPAHKIDLTNTIENVKFAVFNDGTDKMGFGIGSGEFRIFGAASGSNRIVFGKQTGTTFTEHATISNSGAFGIGTNGPLPSAILELASTTRGFLPSRMTAAQRIAISAPDIGLLVFDLDSLALFQYTGVVWQNLYNSGAGGGGGGTVTSVSGTTNRITSTGGATPVIDISSSYVGQSSITTHGTITSGGLGTGAVISGVTMTLGSDATGDLYYRNGSGILTRIATGTSKQALHPNGSGAYVWRDTVTLDFDSIGDYTPTLYNTTNVTTSTAYPTMWQTQGGGIRITVTGQVLVDPSSTGAVVLGIEIPFATSLSQNYSLNGVAVSEITGEPAYITADTTNNRALLQFTATSTASRTYKITFTYDYAPS